MIFGDGREEVINNIKENAESGNFYAKVETGDPVLSVEDSRAITDSYIENRDKIGFKIKRLFAVAIADAATKIINKDTEIVGLEKIPDDIGGMIITSNHFSPLENTVIRYMLRKKGRRKLDIISQTSNFAMPGIVGFLMNYADTIPISTEPRYLARNFLSVIKEKAVTDGDAVLLYPEQEMWFNYRKPRPPRDGAYFYAAKLGLPIVSCFVEIKDTDEDDNESFKKVKYILHILGVLYHDSEKNSRENKEYLSAEYYSLKRECYESVYKKTLTYDFEPSDIAGWKAENA